MTTRLTLLALALVVTTLTPARAQQVQRVEITEYGIYTLDQTNQQRDANGLLHSDVGNIRLAAKTSTVPAQLGVHFGFRYRVIGSPQGQAVELRKVGTFPPPGLKSPTSPQPLRRFEGTVKPEIGTASYTGYAFDDPWELVPGTWTFQLWLGNRKLAEQSFTVVAQ